ncbi:MAG: imidazolonepropionase-like amidohydrolase [Halieaceae bacterium]|jgi:imidazolonepropionase-like amidohydrolase
MKTDGLDELRLLLLQKRFDIRRPIQEETLLPGFMDMHVHLSSPPGQVFFLEARLLSVPRKTVNADAIKFCATGGVFSRGTRVGQIQYSLEEMQAVVSEGHYRDLVVAAHAHGTAGIKAGILAGVDSVEHASMLDEEAIQLAKEHGTYLSMDIYNTEYTLSRGRENGVPEENLKKGEKVDRVQRESFSAAMKAGVKRVFGTDAAIYPHGYNARQFSRMVKFGMIETQALERGNDKCGNPYEMR